MQPPLLQGLPSIQKHGAGSILQFGMWRGRETSELPSYSFPFSLHQLVLLKAYAAADGDCERVAATQGASRASVSQALRRLEKELGTELLEPQACRPHGPLTAAGLLLLRYTDRLLALAADALASIRDLQDVRTGALYIAASQTVGVYDMPRLIERYKRLHPEVAVHLQVENTRRCCGAVARGEADLALVGGVMPPDLEHLLQAAPYRQDEVAAPYRQDEVVLIVPGGHALAGAAIVDREALAGLPFVSLHRSSTVAAIHAELEAHGIDWQHLRVIMEVNSVEAIKGAVASGLGAAFVSAAAVRAEVAAGQLAALRIDGLPLRRTLRVITDPVRYCPKATRAFIRETLGLPFAAPGSDGCFPHYRPEPWQAPTAALGWEATRYPALAERAPHISDGLGPGPHLDAQHGHGTHGGSTRAGAGPANPAAGAEERLPFTLSQLVAFCTLARAGSFRAAALALAVSQPAVSKSLALLEQALGGALVARGATGAGGSPAWLTEAGTALLPAADAMLATAGEAARALHDLRAAHAGRVALGASQTVGTYLMPRLLAAFRSRNPGIEVTLQVEQSRRVCGALAHGQVDCAIIGGEVPEELRQCLAAEPFAQDELALVVPAGHALAARGAVDVAELYALALVSLNRGSTVQAVQEATLRRHGILWRHLNVTMEFNSVEAIKGAVQHGLGAAFVSTAAIAKELELRLLARVDIRGVRLTRTLSLVTCPARAASMSFAARKFLADVCTSAATPKNGSGLLFRTTMAAVPPWAERATLSHSSPEARS
ncbi:hypothetical protein WJX81_005804 [Elliptochloris bilobata]|uniref:Probable RuBisCO transcriptional regulator n=1 Tax=Elliptochloris bilobata TaxID=381761 RepID=A0AAW1RDH4_9CHLO